MASSSTSPLDQFVPYIKGLIEKRITNQEIVRKLREKKGVMTTESSIRRLIGRNDELQAAARDRSLWYEANKYAEPEGVKETKDGLFVTFPVDTPVVDLEIEDILTRRNLSPDEWEVKQMIDNQWEANAGEGEKITLYQYKVWLAKKTPIKVVVPATIPPDIEAPKEPDFTEPVLAVVITDHQAPHIDESLHSLILRWLAANKPAVGVIGGDLMDNGYIGRHRDDPAWDTTTQQGIDGAFRVLYEYRNASLDTKWNLIKGNHDDRIRNEQLERNERLFGIKPAQYPDTPPEDQVYSFNHLLHLKKLGIDYVEPKTTYEFMQVALNDIIGVRHGHKVVKGGALKTAMELGHSIVVGHTHRQSIVKQTVWNSITMQWNVVTAIEAGCVCNIEGGLGFANAGCPDWQPGFATVTLFPDGQFYADLATYEQSGILRWRDQVYSV